MSDSLLHFERRSKFRTLEKYSPTDNNMLFHALCYLILCLASWFHHFGTLKLMWSLPINTVEQIYIAKLHDKKLKIIISILNIFFSVSSILVVVVEETVTGPFNNAKSLFAIFEWGFFWLNLFSLYNAVYFYREKDFKMALLLDVQNRVSQKSSYDNVSSSVVSESKVRLKC